MHSQGLSPLRSEAESKGVLARVVGQLGNTRCRLARSGIGTDRLQAEEMDLQGCDGQVGVGRAPPVWFRPIFTDPQQVRALLLQHGEVLICVPSCRGLSLCLFLFISLFCLHAPGTFVLLATRDQERHNPGGVLAGDSGRAVTEVGPPQSHLNDSDAEFPVTRVGWQPKGHLGTLKTSPCR